MGGAGYTQAIFAVGAAVYGALLVLLLLSGRANRARVFLIAASAASGAWAAAIATGRVGVLGLPGAVAELACSGPWCAFILCLLYRQGQRPRDLHLAASGGILVGIAILGFAFFEPASPN